MTLNLLTNAYKYTDQGFVKVIWEEVDQGSVLQWSVAVDESKVTTIFDAFNQAQAGQMVGAGLGLYGL